MFSYKKSNSIEKDSLKQDLTKYIFGKSIMIYVNFFSDLSTFLKPKQLLLHMKCLLNDLRMFLLSKELAHIIIFHLNHAVQKLM